MFNCTPCSDIAKTLAGQSQSPHLAEIAKEVLCLKTSLFQILAACVPYTVAVIYSSDPASPPGFSCNWAWASVLNTFHCGRAWLQFFLVTVSDLLSKGQQLELMCFRDDPISLYLGETLYNLKKTIELLGTGKAQVKSLFPLLSLCIFATLQ